MSDEDPAAVVRDRMELLTGVELDRDGTIRELSPQSIDEHRQRVTSDRGKHRRTLIAARYHASMSRPERFHTRWPEPMLPRAGEV